MKELSIEEKARRYDKAIEIAKNEYQTHESFNGFCEILAHIFPELKESKDEMIREAIGYAIGQSTHSDSTLINGVSSEEALAWLEKQGEQKPVIEMKSAEESLGIDSDTYNKIVDECIYGEQKLANKIEPKDYSSIDPHFFKTTDNVEPKFKVGDSIISTISNIPYYITEVCNGHYLTDVGCIIMFNAQDNFELVEQKPAWSEEDELMLVSIIQTLKLTNGAAQMKIDWLKSLKERILPKSTWNEEDDEHLERILKELGNQRQRSINSPYLDKIESDYNWLKSIKDRVGCEVNCTTTKEWKPSDEQMDALQYVYRNCNPLPSDKLGWDSIRTLELMYQDLKKLREE